MCCCKCNEKFSKYFSCLLITFHINYLSNTCWLFNFGVKNKLSKKCNSPLLLIFSNGSPCTMYMMLASFTEVGQMLCVGISSCASGITQFLKEACEQLMIWHLDKNCGKWLVYPIQFLVIPVGAWNKQKWVQLLLTFSKILN